MADDTKPPEDTPPETPPPAVPPEQEERIVDKVVAKVRDTIRDIVGSPLEETPEETPDEPPPPPVGTRAVEDDMEAKVRAELERVKATDEHNAEHERMRQEAERPPVQLGRATRWMWGDR